MFVIEKNPQTGKMVLRPAFVRYIENTFVRRTLMILYAPFVIITTHLLNYVIANLICTINLVKCMFDIKRQFKSCWDKPHIKNNKV